MKKKPRASAKRTKRVTPKARRVHNVSDAMRADDEKLSEELRNADLDKFDVVLRKAIRPSA